MKINREEVIQLLGIWKNAVDAVYGTIVREDPVDRDSFDYLVGFLEMDFKPHRRRRLKAYTSLGTAIKHFRDIEGSDLVKALTNNHSKEVEQPEDGGNVAILTPMGPMVMGGNKSSVYNQDSDLYELACRMYALVHTNHPQGLSPVQILAGGSDQPEHVELALQAIRTHVPPTMAQANKLVFEMDSAMQLSKKVREGLAQTTAAYHFSKGARLLLDVLDYRKNSPIYDLLKE